AAEPQLMQRFGGHAMAAGMTLAAQNLPAFRQAFSAAVDARLQQLTLDDNIVTDGELTPAELDLHTAMLLRDAGPWGAGFEPPLFHGNFVVRSSRLLKGKHLK